MLCSPTKKSIFLEKFIEPGTGFFFHWHLRMRVIQFMSHRTTTIFFHNILHVTGQTLFVDCIVLWLTLRLWIRHNATGSLQHLDWRSSICYRSKETRRHCRLVESGGRTTGTNQASNTTQFISSQFHKSFKFNFMSNRCAELFFFLYKTRYPESCRASVVEHPSEGQKFMFAWLNLDFPPFFFVPFFLISLLVSMIEKHTRKKILWQRNNPMDAFFIWITGRTTLKGCSVALNTNKLRRLFVRFERLSV